MAVSSGQAAGTRIQVRKRPSYPASEQVPTRLVLFLYFVFSFRLNSEIIFAFRQITPHHEFVFSLSCFLVCKSFILPKKIAKFIFNTNLYGKKFLDDLIVPKKFLFLCGFSLTLH